MSRLLEKNTLLYLVENPQFRREFPELKEFFEECFEMQLMGRSCRGCESVYSIMQIFISYLQRDFRLQEKLKKYFNVDEIYIVYDRTAAEISTLKI